ncbi:MAG TPA: autotransporter-associated beta strand repeat-containing protein, partial [Gemmataceae bacterium]
TFDLSAGTGLAKDVGAFTSATGTTLALGTGGALTYGWNNSGGTIAGNATGGATAQMIQVGTAATTITSNGNTFGGGYSVLGTGGLAITGTGALPAQTSMTIGGYFGATGRGSVLSMDNGAAHLAATQALNLNSSELAVTGGAAPVTQAMNQLTGSGYTIVTAGTDANAANVTFTPGGLVRANNGTFLFRSGSTGTLGSGAAGASTLTFGNLPGTQLVGGGGGQGTTTVSILPYAIGDDTAGGGGSTLVTYGANGVRTLQAAEYNGTLVGAGPTDNVRLTNAALTTTSLAADQTVNALVIAGAANSTRIDSGATAANLIVGSGTVLNTVSNVYTVDANGNAVPLGIRTATLQTGNANSQQLNVFAAGDLAIGATISTTGGLVKSGAGTLYLTNAANTYTGGTTVNGGTLAIDSLGAINNAPTINIALGGGYLKYRGTDATIAGTVSLVGTGTSGAGGGGLNVVSGTTLTTGAGIISGNGGLLKDGTGTLFLQGTNTFNGPLSIQAGAVAIDGQAALGNFPRVFFDANSAGAAGASLRFLTNNGGSAFTKEFDIVSSNAGIGAGFDTNGNNITLAGVINSPSNNGKGVYKLGGGDLRLTAAELYTGPTQVFGGSLTLGGPNGSVLNAGIQGTGSAFSNTGSLMANFGGTIVLDNTGAGNANGNRIPSGFETGMSGGNSQPNGGVSLIGGNFTLKGNATTAVNEYAGQIGVFAGTITLENNGAVTVLSSGNLNRRSNLSIGLIRGAGLGTGAPAANRTNWFMVDQSGGSTQLGGAGGALGTPYVNILAGFMGDNSSAAGVNTTTGTDLVTYSADVGVRLLTASEYKANAFDGTIGSPNFDASRAPNVLVSANTAAPNFTTWLTALKITGGSALSGTATAVTMQHSILATGNGTPSITVPSLRNDNDGGGYDFLVAGTTNLTVASNLPNNGLFVYGGPNSSSTLTLTGAYYGTGQVFVGQGTALTLSGANAALNPVGSNVNVAFGGALNLGGADRTVASLNTQAVIGTFNLGQVSDGTVNLGTNKLTLYDNATTLYTGQITGGGTLEKGFFSAGTTTITQPQPGFTGTVRVRNGTFQLASGGTLPNASLIDVRGGTLTFNNTDDNAAAGGYVAQRVSATTPINLAGNLNFVGNPNTPGNHSLGTVNLVGGGTITPTPGATAPTTVTVNNLTRAANKGTLVVVPSIQTGAATLITSGFGGAGTGWTTNVLAGSGAGTGTYPSANVLQLTPAIGNSASSAWFNTPVPTGPFTASFTYTVPAVSGTADGFTFGFQNAGLNALGGGGGSLGYATTVTPSAVLAINIFGTNGYAIRFNGATTPAYTPTAPVNPATVNSPVNFTLAYDGVNLTTTMVQGANTFSTGPQPFNLSSVGATAFFGFTGATGGSSAQQQISNFTISSLAATPTLGLAQSPVGGSRVFLNGVEGGSVASALVGGGGAAGTTTISILPWAWSSSGSFVTYDPAGGLRPLSTNTGTGAEYATAIPAAPSNDNVRLGGATTLAAGNSEMNSLIQPAGNITGAAGTASTLTVRSGALAFTAASTVAPGAGGTLALNFGTANTAEGVIFNSANVTLNGTISTTGGVTKFGGGTLTLAAANSFTGGLQINGGVVAYSNDNQLGAAGGAVTFGLATNNASPNGIGLQYVNPGATPAPATVTRNFVTNSFGGIIGPQLQLTTLNGTISGPGVWAYNSTTFASVYEVNGTNTYTGDTYLSGQVGILGDAAFGSGQVIQMNSGASSDGPDLRADWTTGKTIHMRAATGVNTNGFNATVNGPVIGNAA